MNNKVLFKENSIDIAKFTTMELQESRDLIKQVIDINSITITNKLKNNGEIPLLCLMLQKIDKKNNEERVYKNIGHTKVIFDEFICKVVCLPACMPAGGGNIIHISDKEQLFSFLGKKISCVVRCYNYELEMKQEKYYDKYLKTYKTFIEVGLNDLPKLLYFDNEVLSHHLYIFNGITYEALSFLLASYGIRLHSRPAPQL